MYASQMFRYSYLLFFSNISCFNGNHSHQVSTSIFLTGVGLYASTQIGESVKVKVELRYFRQKETDNKAAITVSPTEDSPLMTPNPINLDLSRNRTGSHSVTSRSISLLELTRPAQLTAAANRALEPGQSFDQLNQGNRFFNETSEKRYHKMEAVILSSANAELESDGTNNVHQVHFPCPIKVSSFNQKNQSIVR